MHRLAPAGGGEGVVDVVDVIVGVGVGGAHQLVAELEALVAHRLGDGVFQRRGEGDVPALPIFEGEVGRAGDVYKRQAFPLCRVRASGKAKGLRKPLKGIPPTSPSRGPKILQLASSAQQPVNEQLRTKRTF